MNRLSVIVVSLEGVVPLGRKGDAVMNPDLNPSSTAIEDRVTHRIVSTALTKLRYLEAELVGDDGHMRRDVTPARAEEIVARINDLRQALGWLQIELDGQWRWPASAEEALTSLQRVA
jgi:hypothetical protein